MGRYERRAKGTCENFFEGDFGTITEGKVNIGRDVTFCTVQTLAKQDLSLYKYSWDMVIIDEVQTVVANPNSTAMLETVLNNLAARYKYGLTASLSRADGLQKCAEYLIGKIAYEVPREAIADKIVNTLNISTLEDVMNLTLDDLKSVDKIGEKKALTILKNIHSDL